MDKAAVDAAIAGLESSIHTIDFWALVCGIFVALFLAGEIWFIGAHWLKETRLKPLRDRQAQLGELELAKVKKETASANERAAQLASDLEKERQKTAPRPWTKEQFDAIQSLKGKVSAIGIVSQKNCLECDFLSEHILLAFHEAGAEIYQDSTLDLGRMTGVTVLLPKEANFDTDPIVDALRAAGLNPSAMHTPPNWPVRDDIPIVFVGERSPQYLAFPFFPKGGGSFPLHPLRK